MSTIHHPVTSVTLTAEPDSAPFYEQEQDIDDGDPETNEPFNEDLAKLRSHINHIKWVLSGMQS